MKEKETLSVVIDGKVYTLAGGSESYLQKIASHVDSKIRKLKKEPGYAKLLPEYQNILLALTLTEDYFGLLDELDVSKQERKEQEAEIYRLKQEAVDQKMKLDAADKLVADYKLRVNELQKRIIELETRNERHR